MRKNRSLITVKMVHEWINLYQNNKLTSGEIAEMYGCSATTVRAYLKDFGVPLTRFREHKKRKFYKNHFLIALYDLEEQLVGVFDNVHEFSKYTGKSVNVCHCLLNPRALHKKIRINGKWYRKELIEVI